MTAIYPGTFVMSAVLICKWILSRYDDDDDEEEDWPTWRALYIHSLLHTAVGEWGSDLWGDRQTHTPF